MTATPVRAKLGMVRIADDFSAKGYADHDVYFLGVDDQWRVLNLAELRLPASDWTGPDGSGMGNLSPKGTHWVFVTTRHVVVLDLLTKRLNLLRLPGGRTPVPGFWTVRNTLLIGYESGPQAGAGTTSYEVNPKTGHSALIKAPAYRVSVLHDGTRAIAGWSDGQPFIKYITPANQPIGRRNFEFTWDQHLGLQNQPDGQDSAVFLDSLGSAKQSDSKSMVAVVDQSLRPKATLPWPKRTLGDDILGWVSSDTFLLTYGKTLAAWCPGQSKISRVSTVPRNLAISMAAEVVEASCT